MAKTMDTMYAEVCYRGYETWTYSDGVKVRMRCFASLEGLQFYAKRYGYRIVYC
jgi:hypothetical protein